MTFIECVSFTNFNTNNNWGRYCCDHHSRTIIYDAGNDAFLLNNAKYFINGGDIYISSDFRCLTIIYQII